VVSDLWPSALQDTVLLELEQVPRSTQIHGKPCACPVSGMTGKRKVHATDDALTRTFFVLCLINCITWRQPPHLWQAKNS
jgi:hypothetical protein